MTLYCSSTRCLLRKLCRKHKIPETSSDKTVFCDHYTHVKRSTRKFAWACPFFTRKIYTQEEIAAVHGPNTFRTMDNGEFVLPRK